MQLLRKFLRPRRANDANIANMYESLSYIDAYTAHTDLRVEADPHAAIGGRWDQLGRLQFDYLVSRGLRPDHRLLDIGCGTLRGGRHFIRYLDPERYTGFELSPKALEYAACLVEHECLSDKRPRLVLNAEKNLCFKPFAGERFDYLLAQSVFTHLPPEHISECFAHVGAIMRPDAAFFFTYNEGDHKRSGFKDFYYRCSFFNHLADKHGFVAERQNDYPHPAGQTMAVLRPVREDR